MNLNCEKEILLIFKNKKLKSVRFKSNQNDFWKNLIHDIFFQLDEKENPPKSEWTFQLPESDKRDKAQITLIRNFEDEDDVKTIDVKLDDCKNNKYTWYNLTKTICVKGGENWETNKVNTFINFEMNFYKTNEWLINII